MTATIEYSFVVAIHNDGYLADDFCRSFRQTFERYLNTAELKGRVELIFVNDGSSDASLERLRSLPSAYPFVRVIDLSRSFGQHLAIACGFREARGRFVGRLNVDLQDPPEEIPKLLDILKTEDVDLIVGRYDVRHSSLANKLSAYFFFAFFNWLTGQKTPQNTSPLRVMNRRFIDVYNELHEKTRFPQGLENWLGFRHKYVPVVHQPRRDRRSAYNFPRRLRLALEGVIAFSDRPLKLMVAAGVAIMALGLLLATTVVYRKLFFGTILTGYTSLLSAITVFSGLQVLVMGVTGLYVGKILQEVQDRPAYIIREKINFDQDGPS